MTYLLDWLEDHPRVTVALICAAYFVLPTAFAAASTNAFAGLTGWWH
jgi:hypothetical protein